MEKKVSGCIVTYNNRDVIEECVDTILNNTRELNFTLFVVDNGSTDGTVDIIREKYPKVKIIRNEDNLGFGHGHNKVLRLIDSEYHVVINPDISMDMDAITPLCEYLEEHVNVAMITPMVLNEDGTQQHLPKYCPSIRHVIISKFKPFKYLRKEYTRENENLTTPTRIEFCTGCFFVIRTSAFKELEGFDQRFFMYCEDADLSRRIRIFNEIIFYPYAHVIHKWKRDNTKNLKGVFRFMTSLLKYFIKWGIKF